MGLYVARWLCNFVKSTRLSCHIERALSLTIHLLLFITIESETVLKFYLKLLIYNSLASPIYFRKFHTRDSNKLLLTPHPIHHPHFRWEFSTDQTKRPRITSRGCDYFRFFHAFGASSFAEKKKERIIRFPNVIARRPLPRPPRNWNPTSKLVSRDPF